MSVFFGLAQLRHIAVKGVAAALTDASTKGATGGTRHYIRRSLVVAEVALAVILVVGAGLLVRTIDNLGSVDAGFLIRGLTTSLCQPQMRSHQTGEAWSIGRSYCRYLWIMAVEPDVAYDRLREPKSVSRRLRSHPADARSADEPRGRSHARRERCAASPRDRGSLLWRLTRRAPGRCVHVPALRAAAVPGGAQIRERHWLAELHRGVR